MAQSQHRKSDLYYTTRIKFYPDSPDPVEIMVADDYLFNPSRAERADEWQEFSPPAKATQEGEEKTNKCSGLDKGNGNQQAWNRAQKRAYDYIRCNPSFNMFLTLTFDPSCVDRGDWGQIVDKLNGWLDNRVRRQGLIYILCPEYHHDGQAIHLHGLANENALKLVNAVNPRTGGKLYRNGKTVYNIADYPYGFTTAIRVTGAEASKACAGYIFKYMRKQGAQRIGGRYFLAGGKLAKPTYVYANFEYDAIDAPAFALQGANCGCKVLQGETLQDFLKGAPALVERACGGKEGGLTF